MASPDATLKTYTGSCACLEFTYTVQLPEVTSVSECNCSICIRKGYKWVFPGANTFTVTKDAGKMVEYEFGGKTMVHKFCSICGTGVYGMRHNAPPGMDMGLNVRTLNDIDILSVPIGNTFDGLKLPPSYTCPTPVPAPTSTATGTSTAYSGNCHCAAINMTFISASPLTETKPTTCSCPICVRAAPLLLSMNSSELAMKASSLPPPTTYRPEGSTKTYTFCAVCGVYVSVKDAATTEADGKIDLNLRCFPEMIELSKLNIEQVTEK